MSPSTVLENWYVVSFRGDDTLRGRQVLWGIGAEDPSCRWAPGDWCCTSRIEERDGEWVHTRNRLYQLVGAGTEIELPVEAILALRQGFSPDEYLATKSLENTGYSSNVPG